MIRAVCPTCRKPIQGDSLDELPHFPFCSERCQLIDLGRWIDEEHRIPGPPLDEQPTPEPPPDEES